MDDYDDNDDDDDDDDDDENPCLLYYAVIVQKDKRNSGQDPGLCTTCREQMYAKHQK